MAPSDDPYLRYLTVFRSRLGVLNLVLGASSEARQPERAFNRRVRKVVGGRVETRLDGTSNQHVLDYLTDKKLIGPKPKGAGRYRGWSLRRGREGWEAELNGKASEVISVYQTDIWLSDTRVPSTIGAPTAENADEIVDLAFQFRMIDRNKFSWSTCGQLVNALHGFGVSAEHPNPFVLLTESPVLLRSLLEADGRFQLPLLRFLASRGVGHSVKRDEVADALPSIAAQALEIAWPSKLSAQAIAVGRETLQTLQGAPEGGSGPGVREHRSSPRLEWLTDLGYLSKEGLPRNAFEYIVTEQLLALTDSLNAAISERNDWAFVTALRAWRDNPAWAEIRSSFACDDPREAFGMAYKLLRRPIGPVPLRDVSFVTGMLYKGWQPNDLLENVIETVRDVPGGSLAGGRYDRGPESVYLSESSLKALEQ